MPHKPKVDLAEIYAILRPYYGSWVPRKMKLEWSDTLWNRKKKRGHEYVDDSVCAEYDPAKETIFVSTHICDSERVCMWAMSHEMAHVALDGEPGVRQDVDHGRDWDKMVDRLSKRGLLKRIL